MASVAPAALAFLESVHGREQAKDVSQEERGRKEKRRRTSRNRARLAGRVEGGFEPHERLFISRVLVVQVDEGLLVETISFLLA